MKVKFDVTESVCALVVILLITGVTYLFVSGIRDSNAYNASIKDTYHESAYVIEVYDDARFEEGSSKSRHSYTPVKLRDEQGVTFIVSVSDRPSVGSVLYKDCWTDRNGSWCDSEWGTTFKYQNLTR